MSAKEVLVWQNRYAPSEQTGIYPQLWMKDMPDSLALTNGTTVVIEFKDDVLTIKRTEE